MKVSKYVYQLEALLPDLNLLYSSRSGALLEFDPDEWETVQSVLDAPTHIPTTEPATTLRKRLVDALMIIPPDEDEFEAVRKHRERGKSQLSWLSLTIAPTMQCNFRCTYCFEEHRAEFMSPEVVEALKQFIVQKLDQMPEAQGVAITWFGGEPLMSPSVIESVQSFVNQLCEERGLGTSRSLVTNAYLLDDRMVDRLHALGEWVEVQVTVDGTPLVHNGRRHLVNGRATYDRVTQNASRAFERGLPIVVRMNVDTENSTREALAAALQCFADRGVGNLIPNVYLGTIIDSTPECSHMSETRLTHQNSVRASLVLSRELLRLGFSARAPLPSPACVMCTADSSTGYTVSPRGLLFKCWNEIHLPPAAAIGALSDQAPVRAADAARNQAYWDAYDPLAKSECRECKAMPSCMGGCPWEAVRVKAEHGVCGPLKFYPEEYLQLAHADLAIAALEDDAAETRVDEEAPTQFTGAAP